MIIQQILLPILKLVYQKAIDYHKKIQEQKRIERENQERTENYEKDPSDDNFANLP